MKQPPFKVGDRVHTSSKCSVRHTMVQAGTVVAVSDGSVTVRFDETLGGNSEWVMSHCEVVLMTKPTLATDVSLKPSTRRVLAHLRKRGSISVLEALAAWGTARIAPAIHDLRGAGYTIETVKKTDAGGHQYSRYVLQAA